MITHLKQSSQYQRYIQRQAEKDLRKQKTSQGELAIQIKRMFHSILMQEQLEEIAKETKFIKRNRELTPCALVAVLMIGCSGVQNVATLEVITSYLYEWFNIVMKPQSLQARLNNKEAVAFMKQVTTKVMMHEANKIMEKLLKKYLKKKSKNQLYKRILLQDSTVISLPESVARLFKGCGGSASKAAIKCDVIFDQQSHLIVRIKCVAGKVPDSSLSGDILEYLKEGDLVIRDLGYFNLENFANMFRNKINFISRLKKNVKIYLTENDENPLNLIEYLKTKGIRKKGVDIEVYVGKISRIPMRIIGITVPKEVVEQRRTHHKEVRKCEPSEDLHEWHGFTFMITNITKNKMSLNQILKMYKIRWKIELFFKYIKSYLNIDKITGENKNRILVLVYTKLIVTWITSLLFAYAQLTIGEGKEVSKFKFSNWLQSEPRWKEAIITAEFTELIVALNDKLDFIQMK